MNAVETKDLVKTFNEKRALDGLNLTIPQGSIFGFLGPNGAGKTTALRILLGLAKPTSGTATVLGVSPGEARSRIGYLPDVPGYYDWMTAPEFMRLVAGLCGIQNADSKVNELLEMTGLANVKQRIGGYSRGMKQRLGIAQALVNSPELIFLDEPTSALDPLGRKEVLDCIAGLKGQTIVFSTHILADVERVCDRVAVMNHGKVVASETVESLRQSYGTHALLVESSNPDALENALKPMKWAHVTGRNGQALTLKTLDKAQAEIELPRLCADLGLGLARLEPLEPSLEDIFLRLVGGETK